MAESEVNLTVRGIESESAAEDAQDELVTREGIMGAEIDPETGEAKIRFDVDLVSEERVRDSIREQGLTEE